MDKSESPIASSDTLQKAARQGGVACSIEPIFKRRPWLLVVLAVVAVFIEVLVFNHSALFFDEERFPEQSITLPELNVNGVVQPSVLISEHNALLEFALPDVEVASLYLETNYGERSILNVSAAIKDEAFGYNWGPVATGQIVSTGKDYSSLFFKVLPHGKAKGMCVAFEVNGNSQFLLTKLLINKPLPFNFSIVRILAMFGLFTVISVLSCGCARNRMLMVEGKLYKRINRGLLAVSLGAAFVSFYAVLPWNANNGGFQPVGLGFTPYTTVNHSLLVDLPSTEQQFLIADPYAQQLAAWLKGQLHLDFAADATLQSLDNVYDPSERAAKQVPFLWDRAYYKGQYFSYYGVAPIITTYLPIYLVTGQVPSTALANFINLLFALVAFHYLLSRLTSLYLDKVNPLMLVLSYLAVLMLSQAYLLNWGFLFYIEVYLSAMGFLSLALAWSLSIIKLLPQYQDGSLACQWLKHLNEQKVYVHLALAGIALVGLVASRPLELLMLLVLMVPFIVLFLLSKAIFVTKLKAALAMAVPVLLGAVAIMAYNYMRFDSIFEFGQFKQLTVFDTLLHTQASSVEELWALAMHFIWENFNYLAHFPYIETNKMTDLSLGNHNFLPPRSGVLAYFFTWTVFLVGMSISRTGLFKPLDSQGFTVPLMSLCLKEQLHYLWSVITTLVIVLMVPFLVLEGSNAGIGHRYTTDGLLVLAVVCFMQVNLIRMQNTIHDSPESASFKAMIYISVIVMALITIAQGFFLLFSNESFIMSINPEFYLMVKQAFSPLDFVMAI